MGFYVTDRCNSIFKISLKSTILTAKIQRGLGKGQGYDPCYARHTWNHPSQE